MIFNIYIEIKKKFKPLIYKNKYKSFYDFDDTQIDLNLSIYLTMIADEYVSNNF